MTDFRPAVVFDGSPLTIDDVCRLARREAAPRLSDAPAFRARIRRGADFLDRLLREDGVVYGVTTGYGDSCTVVIPPELVAELPHHLFAYHGVGRQLGSRVARGQGTHVLDRQAAAVEGDGTGISHGARALGER